MAHSFTFIDAQALNAYFACIVKNQYTIRSIPKSVDDALRQRAKREAKSLNAVVIEALARGLELDANRIEHADLDDLIGSWEEDPAFDKAVAEFDRIDPEVWK